MADDRSIIAGVADYVANPDRPVVPRLKSSLQQGVQKDPNTEARMRQLAREIGVPPITITDDKDSQARAQALQLDPNGMVLGAPKTADWLTEPDNAAIAHDDTSNLQTIEQTLKNLTQLGKSAGLGVISGGLGYLQAMDPFFKGLGLDLNFGLGSPTDETSESGQLLAKIRAGAKKASDEAMPKVDNPWAAGVNAGIVSLAQNAPIIAAAVISKNPGLGLAGAGALTGGNAYGEARDRGLSPNKARAYGAVQGGIEIATEALPMAALVGDYVKHSGIATTFLRQLITDVPGEQLATIGQDFTEWAVLNPERPFSEYLAERPDAAISTFVASGVGSAGYASLNSATSAIARVAERGERQVVEAQEAESQAQVLEGLSKAASASALRQRDPQTFQQYVEAVTVDTPVENVYIAADDLVNVLAQGDAAKLAEDTAVLQAMPSVMPQLEDAVASGGLIQIPTSELLAYAPDTALGQSLIEHLKVDPQAFSMAEAAAFLQDQQETFKAEVERTIVQEAEGDAFAASADAVRTNILDQLTVANRFTADINEAYASLVASFYSTTAQRVGVTPEELFKQQPLNIQSQGVQEGSLVNQEVARSGVQFDLLSPDQGGGSRAREVEGDGGILSYTWKDGTATEAPYVSVDALYVEPRKRRMGVAQRMMQDLVAQADAAGVRLALTPEPVGFRGEPKGASKTKLAEFYKSFGFKKNTDGYVSAAMVRDPQPRVLEQPTGAHWSTEPGAKVEPGEEVPFRLTAEELEALNAVFGEGLEATDTELTAGMFSAGVREGKSVAELLAVKPFAQAQWLADQGLLPESPDLDTLGAQIDEANGLADYQDWIAQVTEGANRSTLGPVLPFEQGEKKTPRGTFTPQTNTITLLRDANLSTFLHESGHFFVETLARMASDPSAPAELKEDWARAAAFMGSNGVAPDAWLSIPVDGRREGHERFARGFEAYLREGKAPAAEMQGLFQKFRSWLIHVYESLTQLRIELTDEVRGVFDRLIATRAAIEEAERIREMRPIFASRPEGMDELEWQAYQRLGAEATASAQDELQARSVRDMRWLQNTRARLIRDMTREAAERRKAVRAEIEAEVLAEPVYAAQQFLKRGIFNGGQEVGVHKLSIADVASYYEGMAPELTDWRRLGYGKYGMLAEEGLNPDDVAQLFGFSSGHHLVEELLNAEPLAERVAGLTDQRMLERFGDLTDEAAIAKAADEAIHNNARLRFVATEANALAKAAGKLSILADAARDFAREIVGRQRIRDLRPVRYTGAERRAAVAAARAAAKGDLITAAGEKRNQLINGYAARAAFEAQAEVEKALRLFDRLQSPAAVKSLDVEYREQIDAMLERFDLRKGESLKAIDKRKSLKSWIEAQEASGLEPVIDEALRDEAYREHFKDMTVDELRGLVDAVKNIAHLGRLKHRLLVAADKRAYQAVVDEAEQLIRKQAYRTIPQKLESNTVADRMLSGFANFFAIHRKFSSLIREMSGLKNDGGILWRAFIQPLNAANDKEAAMRADATKALADVFQSITVKKGDLRKKLYIPALGASLSLEGRLAVALNWGNELNRARVMDGDRWTAEQATGILQTLTAEQLGFVNRLWDYLDSYWPQIAAKEQRITGVAPQKVEPEPFQVRSADGVLVDMRGGYYPIKYDTQRSSRSESDEIAENVKAALRGAYTRATTRRGHTKARVEKVERPVRKDLMVPFQHVNQVIHDLAFHEYLIDANRLISNPQIDAAVRDHYGVEVLRTIKNTLDDIAEGEQTAENALERSMNYIRTGATIAGLGWNLTTGLLQPLGLTQTIVRIGPSYWAKGMGRALGDAFTLQDTVKSIGEKSDFMRLRAQTFMREVNEVQNTVKDSLKPPLWGPVENSFFFLIQKLQLIADVPTWLGAYEKAQAEGNDDQRAIALADQAVRDSQGGGQIGDLAQIQRGNVWFKLWTNFYSFFNVGYNQIAESIGETRRVGPARLPYLAADVLLVAVVPLVLGELLRSAVKGEDWDWEEMGPKLAKAQISYLLGFMVGLRELGGLIQNDGKAVSGPASLRLLTQDLPRLYTQVQQGEFDENLRRSAINTAGVLFHFPAGQVNRTIDGFEALAKGETDNPLALAFGPPRN